MVDRVNQVLINFTAHDIVGPSPSLLPTAIYPLTMTANPLVARPSFLTLNTPLSKFRHSERQSCPFPEACVRCGSCYRMRCALIHFLSLGVWQRFADKIFAIDPGKYSDFVWLYLIQLTRMYSHLLQVPPP